MSITGLCSSVTSTLPQVIPVKLYDSIPFETPIQIKMEQTSYNRLGSGCGYGWVELNVKAFAARQRKAAKLANEIFKKHPFEAIAYSGSSGAAFAFTLAMKFQIPVIYARKNEEDSHGSMLEVQPYEGDIKKYLIVDDFICGGSTVKRIIDRINEYVEKRGAYPSQPAAMLCYNCNRREDHRVEYYRGHALDVYSIR